MSLDTDATFTIKLGEASQNVHLPALRRQLDTPIGGLCFIRRQWELFVAGDAARCTAALRQAEAQAQTG